MMQNNKPWLDNVNEWMRKLIPNGELLYEAEVDELTKHEKWRNTQNAINTYKKGLSGYHGIKTFGILSAENPDSQEAPRAVNKKNMKSLSKMLQSGHYPFVKQRGHFGGNDEWSYFVFNIKFDALMYYAAQFEQTSFFYCELKNGTVRNDYYQKQDTTKPYSKSNPYIFIESYEGYMDASDAEDYSIIGKNFKYTIPLKIFETIDKTISDNIKINEGKGLKLDVDNIFNSVGQYAWYNRGALYHGLIGENIIKID